VSLYFLMMFNTPL